MVVNKLLDVFVLQELHKMHSRVSDSEALFTKIDHKKSTIVIFKVKFAIMI